MSYNPSTCIIVGDAPCKGEDLAAMGPFRADVCCVNRAGLWMPRPFEHWFSWHANILVDEWGPQRHGPELHSTYDYPGCTLWKVKRQYGGSGMDAIQVMLECLEYDHVILAGMPMTGAGYEKFLTHWSKLNDLKDRIRSTSGNTKTMFGYPEKEWLL